MLGIWAASLGAWHIPAAYDAALRHPLVHQLEHLSFVTAGFLVWNLLIDPARRGHLTVARRLALAGGVFGIGQLLGDVLLFTPHPLYGFYAAQPHRLFGLSPLHDQQAAGLVMMGEQLVTLGTCALVLLFSLLRGLGRRPALRVVQSEESRAAWVRPEV